MRSKIFIFIEKLKDKFLEVFFPLMISCWYIFLYLQLVISIINRDYSVMLNYGQIALTLFGFTLVSTFFEKSKQEQMDKEQKKLIKKLVRINISFFMTSVAFLFIYSASSVISLPNNNTISVLVIGVLYSFSALVGILGLTAGTLSLYRFLLDWHKEFLKN